MDRLEAIVQTCHLADDYYAVAFEFHQGYRYLSQADVEEFDPIALKHFLLLHALEVALKGWLILEGDQQEPERLSQRPFGHDLGTLLDRVIAVYGVDAFPGDYRPLIDDLNRTYRGKDYEYPARTGPLIAIDPLAVLEQFVGYVSGLWPRKAELSSEVPPDGLCISLGQEVPRVYQVSGGQMRASPTLVKRSLAIQ